jgi:hypothetical protein
MANKCTNQDLDRLELDLLEGVYFGKVEELLMSILRRLRLAEKALHQTETFRQWAHHHLTLCQSIHNPSKRFDLRNIDAHIHECWEFGKALEAWRKEVGK